MNRFSESSNKFSATLYTGEWLLFLVQLPMAYGRALVQSVRPVLRLRAHRLWEVDVVRGIAIVLMVIYHLAWDLWGLAGWPIDMYSLFWRTWQRITAGTFIGLVGVSLHLRYQRMHRQGKVSSLPVYRRALTIFTWGIVISIATYFFQPEMYIRFGILHFIGTAIFLAWPLARASWLSLFLGSVLLLLPNLPWRHQSPWLEWVGMAQFPRPAFDYFPLVPWLGLVLLGIFFGHLLWPRGQRRFPLPLQTPGPLRWLQLAGQNALLLYLIHQPVLITLLILVGVIPLGR